MKVGRPAPNQVQNFMTARDTAIKKLINNPRKVVRESLEGLADLHPGLSLLAEDGVIVRTGLLAAPSPPVAEPNL
jgi:hypothetical protein